VATQPLPTHLVVVRPGTGEVLAVSSNEAADAGNALTGGSRRLEHEGDHGDRPALAGTLTPVLPGAVPGTTVVDGREFENEDQFDLGTVPFTEAFAQSCNTTFIQQALTLPTTRCPPPPPPTAWAPTGSSRSTSSAVRSPATSTGTTKAPTRSARGRC
jgi:cell division protein FtsI/penicillin-binding protein 2